MSRDSRRVLWRLGVQLTVAAVGVLVVVLLTWHRTAAVATPPQPASDTAAATADPSASPAPLDIAALPEARYDAVIPGLVDVDGQTPTAAQVYRTATDLPLFDAPGGTPVARLAARDFLGTPTPVVVVAQQDGWALVLTPARVTLPSQATFAHPAAAQTAGWAPAAGLTQLSSPAARVVVSTARQTVSIVVGAAVQATFPAAVGSTDTPSPSNVVGYLEERYVDPGQGTGDHPIQLTSLHSTVSDEPYEGSDGGLIGIHFSDDRSGAVSHGCIRVGEDAVAALNTLPLGTLVVFE